MPTQAWQPILNEVAGDLTLMQRDVVSEACYAAEPITEKAGWIRVTDTTPKVAVAKILSATLSHEPIGKDPSGHIYLRAGAAFALTMWQRIAAATAVALAVLSFFLGRYEIVGGGPAAYRLDRWTGAVRFIRQDCSYPVRESASIPRDHPSRSYQSDAVEECQ